MIIWRPPSDPTGRFHARLKMLESDWMTAAAVHTDRFATARMAREWLQFLAHHHQHMPFGPHHALVTEHSARTHSVTTHYDVTGYAGEVVVTLAALGAARDESLLTGQPALDAEVLFSLVTLYTELCRDQRDHIDSTAQHDRVTLRRDINAILVGTALPWAGRQDAIATVRRADLAALSLDQGRYRAALEPTSRSDLSSPELLQPVENPDTTMRFATVRHAREWLIHLAGTQYPSEQRLHAQIIDTDRGASPAPVYNLLGSAAHLRKVLREVDDFEGTLLLGLPDVDRRALVTLLAAYEEIVSELGAAQRASPHPQSPREDSRDPVWLQLIRRRHTMRLEISAMLIVPYLSDLTNQITSRMAIVDQQLDHIPITGTARARMGGRP